MRLLGSTRRSLLLLPGVALAASLLLSACGNSEPTEGLGDGSAPETIAPTDESPTPSDDADSGNVDTTSLTTGRWYAAGRGDPFLEFSPENGVTGSDGCNTITSTWEVNGDTVKVASFTSTQKACAGVDSWLSGVASVTMDGDTMSVFNASGETIGELKKVDK